jgi:hypothetical protein
MAVSFDTSGMVGGSAVTQLDLSLTISATANLLIAALVTGAGTSAPTAKWDPTGVNQSFTSDLSFTNDRKGYLLYLPLPSVSGLKTLRANWTGAADARLLGVSFIGVNTTTPFITTDDVNATAATANPSRAVTSDTNGATFVFVGDTGQTLTATTQNSLGSSNTFNTYIAGSYGLGGSSNTHSWTMTATTWGLIGKHIQAQSGGVSLLASLGVG